MNKTRLLAASLLLAMSTPVWSANPEILTVPSGAPLSTGDGLRPGELQMYQALQARDEDERKTLLDKRIAEVQRIQAEQEKIREECRELRRWEPLNATALRALRIECPF